MALKTDDCDIRDVSFYMENGGNSDYYLNLIEFKQGVYEKSLNMRISMSGGSAPTEVKIKIAELFRAMEAAGLNNHPLDNADNNQQQ
jgi:hypothetical protein